MFNYIKLRMKYNTLEAKYESLVEDVKNDVFNQVISKVGEPDEILRLRKENKMLREKNHALKEIIKEGSNQLPAKRRKEKKGK